MTKTLNYSVYSQKEGCQGLQFIWHTQEYTNAYDGDAPKTNYPWAQLRLWGNAFHDITKRAILDGNSGASAQIYVFLPVTSLEVIQDKQMKRWKHL